MLRVRHLLRKRVSKEEMQDLENKKPDVEKAGGTPRMEGKESSAAGQCGWETPSSSGRSVCLRGT